jgi:hypothetical protein
MVRTVNQEFLEAKLPESWLDHFTSEIDNLLDGTAPTIAEQIWDRWLKAYWEMRLLGKPKPLSRIEATEMVYWSLSLGKRLQEALQLIQRMHDMVQFEHSDMFYRVDKKGIAKSQPKATANLLLFFLSVSKRLYASDHIEKVWRDLKVGGIPPELLKKVQESMFALYDPEEES